MVNFQVTAASFCCERRSRRHYRLACPIDLLWSSQACLSLSVCYRSRTAFFLP